MATLAIGPQTIKAQIEKETENFRQLQQEVSKNHTARLRFTQQLQESQMVKKELDLLDDEAVVYKLVGPALIRQDLVEAKANVDKRMQFMKTESERLDTSLKSLENKQNQAQEEVIALQKKLQKVTQK
ncbi:beta subunit of prefoldin [Chloropicon primus]|uniref:Beta subunit of prefoldin n=1 Tax=Chloropicon primus TaxID=1764295 RepID=A0A5B8MF45_9CHLO|nr:beta subunit of prefoldin [Chloropicon primus]UPQ98292.1 beta subunit of prefoldin [Chloropicon primus]|eukprot:QDZ19083.1 beta subunit of prefoldin [Chloropicon primus]